MKMYNRSNRKNWRAQFINYKSLERFTGTRNYENPGVLIANIKDSVHQLASEASGFHRTTSLRIMIRQRGKGSFLKG